MSAGGTSRSRSRCVRPISDVGLPVVVPGRGRAALRARPDHPPTRRTPFGVRYMPFRRLDLLSRGSRTSVRLPTRMLFAVGILRSPCEVFPVWRPQERLVPATSGWAWTRSSPLPGRATIESGARVPRCTGGKLDLAVGGAAVMRPHDQHRRPSSVSQRLQPHVRADLGRKDAAGEVRAVTLGWSPNAVVEMPDRAGPTAPVAGSPALRLGAAVQRQ